jgi:hypothetical protein
MSFATTPTTDGWTECTACGYDISTEADACTFCGASQ